MLRYARFPSVRRYRVEVSGWDQGQNFFVENCDLLWAEGAGKVICLRQHLRPGGVLIVRLVDPDQTKRAHPVVYEAKWVGKMAGSNQFQLTALAPRLRAPKSSFA